MQQTCFIIVDSIPNLQSHTCACSFLTKGLTEGTFTSRPGYFIHVLEV